MPKPLLALGIATLPWCELCPSLCSRVLGSQLAVLCSLRPALVVELSTEILEFSGAVSNIQSKEAIFTHMVSRLLQLHSAALPSLSSSLLALANLIFYSLKIIAFPFPCALAPGVGYRRVPVGVPRQALHGGADHAVLRGPGGRAL